MTTQAPEPAQRIPSCNRHVVMHAKFIPIDLFQVIYNGVLGVGLVIALDATWLWIIAAVLVAASCAALCWILGKHESARAPMLLTPEAIETMRQMGKEREEAEAKARKEAAEAVEPVR